jgi:hypothetical protein
MASGCSKDLQLGTLTLRGYPLPPPAPPDAGVPAIPDAGVEDAGETPVEPVPDVDAGEGETPPAPESCGCGGETAAAVLLPLGWLSRARRRRTP